jgi:Terminase large subunit, T4likevirus-type, N-terminal
MTAPTLDYAGLAEIAARRVQTTRVGFSILDMVEHLDIRLDGWQQTVLTTSTRQLLLNVTRQGGKSTVAALMGLHEIITLPDALVLVVSPGERQSKLLFRTMMGFYRRLIDQGMAKPPLVENKLSLELRNGSQVHALPGDEHTIRGFSGVTLLLIDEASRVADDMEAAVRPMLAVSGGRLVAMSTPWGKRGWWYHAWAEGGEDWQRFEIPATDCPRISPAFLARERRALPQLSYESEYLCQFVEPDDAAFSYESIARAFDSSIIPLFPVSTTEGLTWTE